jgi:hypothetical protein
MSQKPNKNKKIHALPEGILSVRPKSFFNFLPNQQSKTIMVQNDENNKENYLIVDTSQFINQMKTPEKMSEFISDPPTRMLSDSGDELFHDDYGIHPVTSLTIRPGATYYKRGNKGYNPIVPKIENFVHPYKRVGEAQRQPLDFSLKDDIGKEKEIGGKRRRKPHRKSLHKTKRKTRKTRRHRRRYTRKYK